MFAVFRKINILLSAFVVVLFISSCSIVQMSDQAYLNLRSKVENVQNSNSTNEELVSLLDEIRFERSNADKNMTNSYDILETEVQSEFEKRYQDTYNKIMTTYYNDPDKFETWKSNWKVQLEREQQENGIFSNYFYENFVELL